VRLIHVTLAEPVYHAHRAHTSSLSFSSHFPVVAPSNQSFSLLFTHLLELLVPANSSSKLCLLIDQIILHYCNYCLCFQLASSYLAINRFDQSFLLGRLFSAEPKTAWFLYIVYWSLHCKFHLSPELFFLYCTYSTQVPYLNPRPKDPSNEDEALRSAPRMKYLVSIVQK